MTDEQFRQRALAILNDLDLCDIYDLSSMDELHIQLVIAALREAHEAGRRDGGIDWKTIQRAAK